ncbi:hypothetical protein [Flavobacterium pedocola]
MEVYVMLIVFVIIVCLILVVVLIMKNQKDKKELENFFNNDYKKPEDSEANDEGEKF